MIKTDLSGLSAFLPDIPDLKPARRELARLRKGTDADVQFSGWLRLPETWSPKLSSAVKDAAERVCSNSSFLVIIGAGGSFLGAKAALDLLSDRTANNVRPEVLFIGNTLSSTEIEHTIERLGEHDFSLNVISKSGSTLETLAAFHVFFKLLKAKYGSQAEKRVYITTGTEGGPLRKFADENGISAFDIPSDVGGRFSVLTAVGLFPMAVAGIDIDAVMTGAREELLSGEDAALTYAAARQSLYKAGKKIEILASFEPAFDSTALWWRQLFGESEGKAGRGIFPSTCSFTSDLHSMGQYIQDGERSVFETFVSFAERGSPLAIPSIPEMTGPGAKLAGRRFDEMNSLALKAVADAHIAGGVPLIRIEAPEISPHSFGSLVSFFELSCAVSAMLSGVSPFDQPGVEAYKNNLYRTLGIDR